MKTSINKTVLTNSRNEYLNMMAEVERRRAAYKAEKAKLDAEENAIVGQMFDIAADMAAQLGHGLTAQEISDLMNGVMSREEVVGQMVVALDDHYNGSGKTKKCRRSATARVRKQERIKREYDRQVRRYIEVDESGKPVKGAPIKEFVENKTRYIIKKPASQD